MLGWHGVPTGFGTAPAFLGGRYGSLSPSLCRHGKRVPTVKDLIIHEENSKYPVGYIEY